MFVSIRIIGATKVKLVQVARRCTRRAGPARTPRRAATRPTTAPTTNPTRQLRGENLRLACIQSPSRTASTSSLTASWTCWATGRTRKDFCTQQAGQLRYLWYPGACTRDMLLVGMLIEALVVAFSAPVMFARGVYVCLRQSCLIVLVHSFILWSRNIYFRHRRYRFAFDQFKRPRPCKLNSSQKSSSHLS